MEVKRYLQYLQIGINNEYSHLCGGLERGGLPIKVPEMNSAAKLILERIEYLDRAQKKTLLKRIGETTKGPGTPHRQPAKEAETPPGTDQDGCGSKRTRKTGVSKDTPHAE